MSCLVLSSLLLSRLDTGVCLPHVHSYCDRRTKLRHSRARQLPPTSALLYGVTPVCPACSANVLGHLTLTSWLLSPPTLLRPLATLHSGFPPLTRVIRRATKAAACSTLQSPLHHHHQQSKRLLLSVLQHWIPHPTTQYAACSAATLLLYSLEPRTDAGFRCGAFMTLHSHSIFPFPLHYSPPATTVLAWPSGWPHLYGSLARQIAVSSSATRAYQQPCRA